LSSCKKPLHISKAFCNSLFRLSDNLHLDGSSSSFVARRQFREIINLINHLSYANNFFPSWNGINIFSANVFSSFPKICSQSPQRKYDLGKSWALKFGLSAWRMYPVAEVSFSHLPIKRGITWLSFSSFVFWHKAHCPIILAPSSNNKCL